MPALIPVPDDVPSSPLFLLLLAYLATPPVLAVAALILLIRRRRRHALFLVGSALLLLLPIKVFLNSDAQTALYYWVPLSLVLLSAWPFFARRSADAHERQS